jgi:hypothetical protein
MPFGRNLTSLASLGIVVLAVVAGLTFAAMKFLARFHDHAHRASADCGFARAIPEGACPACGDGLLI